MKFGQEDMPMRPIVILAALPLFGAAPPAAVQPAAPMQAQDPYAAVRDCPETPMSLARKQGGKPKAQRLGELPGGIAFMAVDRRVGGCAAPMLMREARR
jgi:hypothetical protein